MHPMNQIDSLLKITISESMNNSSSIFIEAEENEVTRVNILKALF